MKDTILKVKDSIINLMEKNDKRSGKQSDKQRAVERASYERVIHSKINECDYYTQTDIEEESSGVSKGVLGATILAFALHSDQD